MSDDASSTRASIHWAARGSVSQVHPTAEGLPRTDARASAVRVDSFRKSRKTRRDSGGREKPPTFWQTLGTADRLQVLSIFGIILFLLAFLSFGLANQAGLALAGNASAADPAANQSAAANPTVPG